MSLATKFDIMIASGGLAVVWMFYAALRERPISSELFRDQVGMASSLISGLIFISNFSGLFAG
jgi:hypothetical protein